MKRILLTGMSGTGKSSIIEAMRGLGYIGIDMDEPGWSVHDAEGNQLWNESRLQAALDDASDSVLFIAGCAENQRKFYQQLSDIVLLSAPKDVIVERLRHRTNNPYGKRPGELEEVLAYVDTVEPLLRRSATIEIDTSVPLDEVVHQLLVHLGSE